MTRPRHRIAIIGLGMAVTPHARSLQDLANRVEVAAAYSRSEDRRAAFARDFPFPVSGNLDGLLADPTIDSVMVLTPPTSHGELAARAAAAGKHVLLEKPIEVSTPRAEAAVAACEAAGVALGVVFQHRFRPAAERLKAIIAGGQLGDLLSVSAQIRWWRAPGYFAQPGRGMKARDGGGVLLTQAIHQLDLMLWLAGPATRATAFARTSALRRIDTEDIVAGAVEFACGAIGVVDATTVADPGWPERIEIAGTGGSAVLVVERLETALKDGTREVFGGEAAGGGGADPMAFDHANHRKVLEDFLDAIDEKRPPRASGRSALEVLKLIDALLASAESGAAVAIAP